jgi:hypothetical protein
MAVSSLDARSFAQHRLSEAERGQMSEQGYLVVEDAIAPAGVVSRSLHDLSALTFSDFLSLTLTHSVLEP